MKEIDTFKRDKRGVRKAGVYAKKFDQLNTEPGNMADLGALLDVAIEQIGNRRAGRIAKYSNSKNGLNEFLEATRDYFEYIKDTNSVNEEKLIPDIEGLCAFCGITRATMLNYVKRGSEWEEAISYIKDCILSAKKQLAYRSKVPPMIFLNDLINNFGYFNTTEFRLTTTNVYEQTPQLSREEIAARYASLEKPEDTLDLD